MSIRISERYGLNPSLMTCIYCGEASGVAVMGQLKNDAEAPRRIPDIEGCRVCNEKFKGKFRIVEAEPDPNNPNEIRLTGRWWVFKESFQEVYKVKLNPVTLIDPKTAERIGLNSIAGGSNGADNGSGSPKDPQ